MIKEQTIDQYQEFILSAHNMDFNNDNIVTDATRKRRATCLDLYSAIGMPINPRILNSKISDFIREEELARAILHTHRSSNPYQLFCEYIVDNHILHIEKLEGWRMIKTIDKHIWGGE